MKRSVARTLIATISSTIVASAMVVTPVFASTPLVLTPLHPTLSTGLSGGDEISQVLAGPSAIYLVGTLESTTSPLVTSTPLGVSDGFISQLNPQGGRNWDLRLGTAGDDVASAANIGASGNIWIAGASAPVSSNQNPSVGLVIFNLWEVGPQGILENTFSKKFSDAIVPQSISFQGNSVIVQGATSRIGKSSFTLKITTAGAFSTISYGNLKSAAVPGVFNTTSAAYRWLIYSTNKGIKGVTGFIPGQQTTVLIKSSAKTGNTQGIYSVQGAPLFMQYQSGIGVVITSEDSQSYWLTILHTK